MLPLSNIHTHTVLVDGKDTPEEMVQAALALGFHTLGFSEHGYSGLGSCCMPQDTEPRYRAEIRRLREKYAGRIHILLGYEHDYPSASDLAEYEYAIESVHYLRAGGEWFAVDNTRPILEDAVRRHFGGDPYAMCREYFRTVNESIRQTQALVLGHIELVMKFNEKRDLFDDADPRYLKCALETAELAALSGRLVEINSGAISRGYRTQPYPGPAMLRLIREKGGRIILTSDCHDRRFLDCNFAESAALARACGFKTAWQMRGDRLEEYPL